MAQSTNHLPAVSLLALLKAVFMRRSGAGMPGVERKSCFRMVGIERGQLDDYRKLFGFGAGTLPVSFYYLVAQRAHLAEMVHKTFPFRLAGMIHVENAITEFAPPAPDGEFMVRNALRVEPRTETGAQFCIFETLVEQGGQPVFRCESRYLAVRGASKPKVRLALDGALGASIGNWQLAQDEGRRYARVSGDWNPIHLWRWSARLLGLQQPIVHGMHTIGKACALLEQAGGRRLTAIGARFVAPIPLGSEVRLEADWATSRYFVLAGGRLAVEGSFSTGATIVVL